MEKQQRLPIGKEYSQNWHVYHLAKTNEKRLFYELLHDLCLIIQEPKQEMGRKRATLKDLIFSLGIKLYSNYSGRKSYSDLVHAEKAGYIKKAPATNTLNDFLNCEATSDLLMKLLTISAMPLGKIETDFAMDSSGFGSYQYDSWMKAKYQNKKGWKNYLKAHIVTGTKTNVICSCEITPGNFSDIKQAPKILGALKENFNPKRISGDKAYSSYRVHQIIQSLGAFPYIPFQYRIKEPSKNAPKIWNDMFLYFKNNKEEFMKNYHRRSNVETTFAMVKLRLGEHLRCKNFVAQRNELIMKLLCHNICCLIQEIFELGLQIDFRECEIKFVDRKLQDDYPEDAVREYQNQEN
jgi:transposase